MPLGYDSLRVEPSGLECPELGACWLRLGLRQAVEAMESPAQSCFPLRLAQGSE